MTRERFALGILGWLSVLIIGTCVVVTIFCVVGETIEHFTPQPTADQRYGCTIKQQAPNGDCP